MTRNLTLLQFFHWYYPADGSLWNHLAAEAKRLHQLGITGVWLPPAGKAAGGIHDVGYAAYDLYDLGEFRQKGTTRTKYGSRSQYMAAVRAAHRHQIEVYADVVFNHKAGGDEKERFPVRKVNPENRKEFISDTYEVEAYTKFTCPGRKGKYSQFVWDWHCFSGVDHTVNPEENAIFSIQNEYGEGWQDLIEEELGNYDYLMFNDLDFRNPSVREELKRWGEWFVKLTDVDGFRMDAVKHISPEFMKEWVQHMRSVCSKPLFVVGEYWQMSGVDPLIRYIEATGGELQLFDVTLHRNLHQASKKGKGYNLSALFEDTLVRANPGRAITIVDNHDTQPLQALESPVDHWFKPHAYALILLREQGIPCVFYPALYGAEYTDRGKDGKEYHIVLPRIAELERMLPVRRDLAYGFQRDYIDHPSTIGWTREGDDEHPSSGIAVLLSNGSEGFKRMQVGPRHGGKRFVDRLGHRSEIISIDGEGYATFLCNPGSVSVWVREDAGRG